MEHDNLVSGLIRKRAEIAGLIEAAQDHLRNMQTDLAHVDGTLRLFRPDINLSGIKVRPMPTHTAALYGEMTKAIMETLRVAPGPMNVRSIVLAIMERRELARDDGALVASMHTRVGAALRTMKARGTAVSDRGQGLELVWRLA